MRRLSSIALTILACTVATAAHAETAAEERQALVDHLQRTSALLHEATAGLSAEQLAFRAAEGKWSITEVAEHLALTEDFLRGAIEGILASEPVEESAEGATRQDEAVSTFIVDRSQKFQAPEPLKPEGRTMTFEEAMAQFDAGRAKTAALAADADDLRTHVGDHPAFGALDAYGWVLFLSGHTERHTLQIEEIKADPAFPES